MAKSKPPTPPMPAKQTAGGAPSPSSKAVSVIVAPERPRRTDAALKPATPLEVIVSRALDEELDWFHAYAQGRIAARAVAMLPSYAIVRIAATDPEDIRAKARELALTVQRCLLSLRAPHASVLGAAYTPRRWSGPLERAFESATPIAVRLALADDPWPARGSRAGLEEAAASRLSAAIVAKSARLSVIRLRTQADRLLGKAIAAYASARALEGGAHAVA